MKTKNYSKEYLMNSINFLRGEIRQTKFRIQSLDAQIRREKQKLSNTYREHDHLWMLRDKMRYELNILKMYRNDLKQKETTMNRCYNNHTVENNTPVVDTSNMTTMEVLEMNNPQVKIMGEFFRKIMY